MQKTFRPQWREKHIKSSVPIYAAGALWLLYALIFPLYRPGDFIVAAVLSAGVYMLAGKVFKGKKIVVQEQPAPVRTGNTDVDAIITQGRDSLIEIRQSAQLIKNQAIVKKVYQLEQLSDKIFAHISNSVQAAMQSRKFLNYYLPTTAKLLSAYNNLQAQGIKGENIDLTMKNIEAAMDTILIAFERQLDSLFRDEALDISTDITVMQNLIEMEGLTDDPFKMK